MKNEKGTKLAYFLSKDRKKLVEFVASLPFKIEIKSINFENKKYVVYFVFADYTDYPRMKLKNLNIDEVF